VLVRAASLDGDGPRDVGLEDAIASFRDIEETLYQVGSSLLDALERIAPAKATVEFGLEVAVKGGRLLSVLVDAGSSASLKVTLEWTPGAARHAG
jgi:hypothetical protein